MLLPVPIPFEWPADALSSIAQFRVRHWEDSMTFFRLRLIASIISASTQLAAQILSNVAVCRWRRRMLRAMRTRSRQ
jgi:hypothetical protein